jgi:hypothetical protein
MMGIRCCFGADTPKVLLMVGITALAYFLPDILIRNYAQKRRQAIKLELPNALDQMLISVQAGLGFESAMARAGQNGQGPLADELIRTLQDIQVGRSRKEAYLAMAQRVDVPDLRSSSVPGPADTRHRARCRVARRICANVAGAKNRDENAGEDVVSPSSSSFTLFIVDLTTVLSTSVFNTTPVALLGCLDRPLTLEPGSAAGVR